MSVLQDLQKIRREIGEKTYREIELFLIANPSFTLTDVYYTEAGWNTCEEWRKDKANMVLWASDIKIGSNLAEEDGFLFEVTEIVSRSDTTITVRLCCDYSYFREHWASNGGILKTFSLSDSLCGI
jgi:hypothetical protein